MKLGAFLKWYTFLYLGSSENVIPDGGSAKVNMKICIAAFDTHQAVFLYFWVHHFIYYLKEGANYHVHCQSQVIIIFLSTRSTNIR